ncbi:hypothetical protein [Parasphingorhabdus sp.]|uniref:hypothetical protein n=1 Tax=Parasphingorhabdus sp. TaxID=2709688 RepID=UPI003C750BA1
MKHVISCAVAAAMMVSAALPTIAHAQSPGVQSEIVVTGKYQKLWDKGVKLESQALENLINAERDMNDASKNVLDAKSKRDNAQSKIGNASDEFRQMTANVPTFASSKDAAKWADKLSDAAKSWAKNDNRHADGQGNLTKAMKQQSKAQEAIVKAQSDIDKARAMKAEAQQRSMATSS